MTKVNKKQNKDVKFYENVSKSIDKAYKKAEEFSKADVKTVRSNYKFFYSQ
jgi:hypothetical protein